jgi:3'(2'), 5'-bisphosphate nucleotidase
MSDKINIIEINKISVLAGKAIMEIYHMDDSKRMVEYKSDNSPLTLADKKSHHLIVSALDALGLNIPVISEEGKDMAYELRRHWDLFWLVDPLDGTKEFIKRNGEFTVNIALIHKGAPVLGSIYVPVTQVLYFGSKTGGAFKTEAGITVPIHVSDRKDDLVAVGSRSHASERETDVLKKYHIKKTLTAGSSLKFCMIAEGSADVYYRDGPTMEWDTAAGQAIVEAAAGKVLDKEGNTFRYNKINLLNDSFICLGTSI